MVVWSASRPRSRSSSSTSRNESEYRRYQRTAHRISPGSVCRHLNIAGRIAFFMISSGYQPPFATVATQPPQGKATVLDVRPTESPLTCLPRSGLSSAHVSSRTRAFNRNKSPHVSRLRGRRSQRRGEVVSLDVSVVDAHPDRSSPKWPRAGRSLLFSKETRGMWTVRGTQNMTAIDNRFPKPRPLLGPGRPVAF